MLVKLADHGPVIFCHTRVGYDGRRFQCLKFRSMVINADEVLRRLLDSDPESRQEWERTQILAKDPRITPLGKFPPRQFLIALRQIHSRSEKGS